MLFSRWHVILTVYMNCMLLSIAFAFVFSHGDTTAAPALIPMPQSVTWTNDQFDLNNCHEILIADESLRGEAVRLQKELEMDVGIRLAASGKAGSIFLQPGKVRAPRQADEAYRLSVTRDSVVLIANTAHGIFNGIQTLMQLMDGQKLRGCKITDYPAFAWRGFMVDVGRNYQSPEQLRQQIDVMSRYKLNIFHFHLTEDIAWRLQIKKFPQLTAPASMTRDSGKFYSIDTMRALISYCKQRHILLVPEIDIPGHSSAFKRAMGTDMQSKQGTEWVKQIFEEVCSTYDLPYLHIGADEVKITNPRFIPEIEAVVRKHGTKLIGWSPGGNYDNRVVRQLWKEEEQKPAQQYIDSRFLYLSDYDPMSSVVTIFNRRIGGKPFGDPSLLGAEICLWNDRDVTDESDLISRNALYPSMLAFSERSWRGGGYPGVVFSIGEDATERSKAFFGFESRLLQHKNRYFSHLSFVYVKQKGIRWKLFGPFENKGDLSAAFWPEQEEQHPLDSTAAVIATGGTIWLRHTQGPGAVKAWIDAPKENTTWYAYTQLWSSSDTTLHMWIETKDLSRSGADATPPKGEWDYEKSKIWLNGTIIPPPDWAFPGRPSGQLNAPMVDENFYYRPPMAVKVHKGWNEVLLKLPMGKFDPNADWQAPPKWMFTVVPVHKGRGINWDGDEIKFVTTHHEK